ncbi:RNA-binding protein [Scytonema sp. PRP1]|uniref:RNA-binding protein n=1 Tax=Scytonema sp. PRP1 TaxID=3120513 RepID=UPI002FD44051
MTLFVGNLFFQVTEANLRELLRKFAKAGKIDIFSAAGFATVAIEGEANEERAVQELNGVEQFGQKLKLFKSAPVQPSDNQRDGERRPLILQAKDEGPTQSPRPKPKPKPRPPKAGLIST